MGLVAGVVHQRPLFDGPVPVAFSYAVLVERMKILIYFPVLLPGHTLIKTGHIP